jgi:hypothetical protein
LQCAAAGITIKTATTGTGFTRLEGSHEHSLEDFDSAVRELLALRGVQEL